MIGPCGAVLPTLPMSLFSSRRFIQQLNDRSIWLKSLDLPLLPIVVVESHLWMDLVMTQEEEEKFLIHIQEWLQPIIVMVEILRDANETENHSRMLGMRQNAVIKGHLRSSLKNIIFLSHLKINFLEYAKTNDSKNSIFKRSNSSFGRLGSIHHSWHDSNTGHGWWWTRSM